MTPYQGIAERIRPCNTLFDLIRVWQASQDELKAMPEGDRLALVAMKDFYKGMITRGEIDEYLAIRKRVEKVVNPVKVTG